MSQPATNKKKRKFEDFSQANSAVSAQGAGQQAGGDSIGLRSRDRAAGVQDARACLSLPAVQAVQIAQVAPASQPRLASQVQAPRRIFPAPVRSGPMAFLPADLLRVIAQHLDLQSFGRCRGLSRSVAQILAHRSSCPSRIRLSRLPDDIDPLLYALRTLDIQELVLDTLSPLVVAGFIETGIAHLDWRSPGINYGSAYFDSALGDALARSRSLKSLKIGLHCDPGSGPALIAGLESNRSLQSFECRWVFHSEIDQDGQLSAHLIRAAMLHPELNALSFRVRTSLAQSCKPLQTLRPQLKFEFVDEMEYENGERGRAVLEDLYASLRGSQAQ